MSVQTELQRIIQAKADIIDSIEAKGVTVPSGTTIDNLDDYVDQIQQGGGDTKEKWTEAEMFTITALGNVELKTKQLSNNTSYIIPLWYKINNNDWVKFFPFTKTETLTINLVENDTLKFYYEDDGNMYNALNSMIQNMNNYYFPKLYLYSGDINVSGYVDALVGPYKTDKAYYFGAITSGYGGTSDGVLNAIDASGLLFAHQNDYTDSRYKSLFYQWTNLTTISTLPTSKYLGYQAYYRMLSSCTSLTNIPTINTGVLGQGSLESFCYNTHITTITINAESALNSALSNAFSSCTSLTTANINIKYFAPDSAVCSNMFYGCTNLTTVHMGIYTLCYSNSGVFTNCSSLTDLYFDNLYYIRQAANLNNLGINSTCNIYLRSLANKITGFTNTNILYGDVLDPTSNVHGNCDFYLESLENGNVLTYTNNSGGTFPNIKYYDDTTNTWVSWDPANTITLNEHEKIYLHAFANSNNNNLCSITSSKHIKAAGSILHLAGNNGIIVDLRNNTNLVDITDVLFVSILNSSSSYAYIPNFDNTGITQFPAADNFIGNWGFNNLTFNTTGLSGTIDTRMIDGTDLWRATNSNRPFGNTQVTKLITNYTSRIAYPGITSGIILYNKCSNYGYAIINFFNQDSVYAYFGKIRIKLNGEIVEIPFDNVNNCYKANLTIKTGDVLGILHDIGNTTTKIVINNTEYPCTYGQLNYYTMTNNYSTISITYNTGKTTQFGNWYVITLS